ncbi:hypothetical protein B0T20DRAFT_400429 [Sordaria brevicollis]|uniref:Secreted protein n=1 Tax=Sordaria brevicollis TaxID=83679 RepID=A0AAE0PNZ3_SORBR|nr:hypothetical protein B0T20DRAFT_400429 [Sordaria brevicollis]
MTGRLFFMILSALPHLSPTEPESVELLPWGTAMHVWPLAACSLSHPANIQQPQLKSLWFSITCIFNISMV